MSGTKHPVICLTCGYKNEPDSVHCAQCGARLGEQQHTSTLPMAHLSHQEISQLQQVELSQMRIPKDALVLFISHDIKPIIINDKDHIMLGRYAPNASAPTVDLNPYGGQHLGVSRQHAVIKRTEDTFTLTDLDSTNGTFLNEKRIAPNIPFVLHSSDLIQVGHLVLRVYF